MLLLRPAVACLLPLALLTACGGEGDTGTQVGDVIPARYPDQFEDGRKSVVAVPLGRLVLRVADPVDHVEADATRELAALDAPAGASFVPLTWQYNNRSFADLTELLDTSAAPVIDLVTDGQTYRLPSPDLAAEEGESMFVVVDGDAEDLAIAVEFDGVTQTLDLETGERDADAAKPLYTIGRTDLRTKACESEKWFDHEENAVPTFTCDLTGPALLPYAAGRWAAPGRQWLVVTVATKMGRFMLLGEPGTSAHYTPAAIRSAAELGGKEPAEVLPAADGNACPSQATGTCSYTAHLVFDVRADGKLPDRLSVEQRYRMSLFSRTGLEAKQRRTVVGEAKLRLAVRQP